MSELKKELEAALSQFCKDAEETRQKFYGTEIYDAVACVYEDVFRCLSEFEKALTQNSDK